MVKNLPASVGDLRDTGPIPGWVRSPGSMGMAYRKYGWHTWQPSPVFMPGESHGQRGLASYST